jgi:adenylosuccinate lyase
VTFGAVFVPAELQAAVSDRAWIAAMLEAESALARAEADAGVIPESAAARCAGDAGPEVLRRYAEELDLLEPEAPWHTNRVRISELGAVLESAAAVMGKIGLDVSLLAHTEVAEVAEPAGGRSSTMPQKRNPVGSALARALQAAGYASVLAGSLLQEHERAASTSLGEELHRDERVGLSDDELAAALDPASYLGSAGVFVDRVLTRYRAEVGEGPA